MSDRKDWLTAYDHYRAQGLNARKAFVMAKWHAGWTVKEIAPEIGVTPQRVYQILKEAQARLEP